MTANLVLVFGRTKGQRRIALGFKAPVKPVTATVPQRQQRPPQAQRVRAEGRRAAARGGRR